MIIFLAVLTLACYIVGCYFYSDAEEKLLGGFFIVLGIVFQVACFWLVSLAQCNG
jgi:hypothetical protein